MKVSPDSQLKRKVVDSEEVARQCEKLEGELNGLRVAYEQYFLGLERHAPSEKHASVRKQVNELRGTYVRQTALKFRVGGLEQKLITFERLWKRTLQEMESGTYRRDLFKARLHARAKGGAEAAPERAAAKEALATKDAAPAKPPETAKPGPSAKPALPNAQLPGQLSDAKVKAIYDAYVTAKRRCGEDPSKVTLEALTQTLRKQVPELMKQHKARSVDFKVVIKDGKAVLRAVPKE